MKTTLIFPENKLLKLIINCYKTQIHKQTKSEANSVIILVSSYAFVLIIS